MLKRILAIAIVAVMLLSLSVSFVSADSLTVTVPGSKNIRYFSNGYHGFCLDNGKTAASGSESYVVAGQGTSTADNNNSGADVSLQLKVFFTHCFESLFVSDGNGGYYIPDSTDTITNVDNVIQAVVWHYTDGHWWGSSTIQGQLIKIVDTAIAEGVTIPDEGYEITLTNGDKITFSFLVVTPVDAEKVQDYFAYKFSVTPAGSVEEPSSSEVESSEVESSEVESSEVESSEVESSEVESSEVESSEVESSEVESSEVESSEVESSEVESSEVESSEVESSEVESSEVESSEDSSDVEYGGTFHMDVSAPETYVAGEEVEVTVTVNNVNVNPGLHHVNGDLYFDSDILEYQFGLEDRDLPGTFDGYNEWEGNCKLTTDENGNWYIEVDAATSGAIDEETGETIISTVTQSGVLSFTFNFVAKQDAVGETVVYIPDETVNGDYSDPENDVYVDYGGTGSADDIIDAPGDSETSSGVESSEVESSEEESSEVESSEVESSEIESSKVESSEVESSEVESSEVESSEEESSEVESSEVESSEVESSEVESSEVESSEVESSEVESSEVESSEIESSEEEFSGVESSEVESSEVESSEEESSEVESSEVESSEVESSEVESSEVESSEVESSEVESSEEESSEVESSEVESSEVESSEVESSEVESSEIESSEVESSEVESSEVESSEEESSEVESSEAESSEVESSEVESSEVESSEVESSEVESSEVESSEETSDESEGIPQTGDNSNLWFWGLALIMALAVGAVAAKRRETQY